MQCDNERHPYGVTLENAVIEIHVFTWEDAYDLFNKKLKLIDYSWHEPIFTVKKHDI